MDKTNKKGKEKTQFFLPGDKVLWKGVLLIVEETFPDGSVEATSLTMRVRVSDPQTQLSHYSEVRRSD